MKFNKTINESFDHYTVGDISGRIKYLNLRLEREEIDDDTYDRIINKIVLYIDKLFNEEHFTKA